MTAPRMPASLRDAEKAAWRAIVDEFGGTDALRPSDATLLRSLAILSARLEDIRAALAAAASAPPPEPRPWSRHSGAADAPTGYLVTATVRGVTGNPLLGHERETIKELRLLHERLDRLVAGRMADPARPQSLREMRAALTSVTRDSTAKTG